MKTYSDEAVTKTDLTSVDEKQTEEIRKLKLYISVLAATTAINFCLFAAYLLQTL